METGEKVKLKIEKLSLGGDGIARLPAAAGAGGMVVFVPYTAPGDEVEAEITDRKKTFARGRILKIHVPSTQRVVPPCAHFFDPATLRPFCGGCDFQHLNYQAQCQAKEQALKETLEKIAGLKPEIGRPLAMPEGREWRYRNKVQVPFAKNESGEAVAGFYSPGTHTVVPLEDCLIHSESMVSLIRFVVEKMNEWNLEPYLEKAHRGWLRHLLIREEKESGNLLAGFVTTSEFFPKREEWISHLREKFPKITGICQNINPEKTNVILGRLWRTLFGKDYLVEKVVNTRLKVSASSFFQVNTEMAEKLYGLVRDWAGTGKILLDLYCGVGGIGILSAPFFDQVLGADEVPSSISDAQENLKLNKVSNCRFFCKDVRDFLKDLKILPENSTAVLDPPRAGCSPEVLRHLVKAGPSTVIYVSCDPGTLARDLKYLSSNGFKVKIVQPVDLFPQSSHIESVTLLEKVP